MPWSWVVVVGADTLTVAILWQLRHWVSLTVLFATLVSVSVTVASPLSRLGGSVSSDDSVAFQKSAATGEMTSFRTSTTTFGFNISAPSSVTVEQGSTTPSIDGVLIVTLTSGSPSPVTFSVASTLPTGVTAKFGVGPCIPSPTCLDSVSFTANSTATVATSIVEIQGTGGRATNSTSISLTVLAGFDFDLSIPSPSSLTVVQGSTSEASTITATLVAGSPSSVGFSVNSATLPAGVTAFFTNSPCGPTCAVTVSFSATNSAPLGTFSLTILATNPARSTRLSLTILPPSFASVGCGNDSTCSVVSNTTLSNMKFAGNTIHVEADGPHGAHGYANVTVPKSSIPDINGLHVFVDNNKLGNSEVNITSNSTAYSIYFTFTLHSPVLIDIQLTSPQPAANTPAILGLNQTIFYLTIGAVVAFIAIVSIPLAVRRRGRTVRPR